MNVFHCFPLFLFFVSLSFFFLSFQNLSGFRVVKMAACEKLNVSVKELIFTNLLLSYMHKFFVLFFFN